MDKLAERMALWIEHHARGNWKSLIDEDDNEAIPDEDRLILNGLEDLTEWLADQLRFNPVVQKAIEDARYEIREAAAEDAAYQRAMNGGIESQLNYHGMSIKDFI